MAGRTLRNFLVGLGLDTTEFEGGQRRVNSGLNQLRTNALQIGALAGGAFGFNQLTAGFARSVNDLDRFGRLFGALPNTLRAIGTAVTEEGGSLEGFLGTIESIERLRTGTPQQIASIFAEAGIRGVDPSIILEAENATEAYLALADVIANLPRADRLRAQEAFGLTNADVLVLSRGREEIEAFIARQTEIRPLTEEQIRITREYNKEWIELTSNVGGVADGLSERLLPVLTGLISTSNEFFDLWREGATIGEIIDETAPGGRLSAEASGIPGAEVLDTTLDELTTGDGILSPTTLFGDQGSFLDTPISELFDFDDDGPQPTFDDPRTQDIANDLMTRLQRDEQVREIPGGISDSTVDGSNQRVDTPTEMTPPNIDVSDLVIQSPPPALNQRSEDTQRDSETTAPTTRRDESSAGNQRPRFDLRIEIDGQAIDARIISVNERQDSQALEDIRTSTRG